MRLRTWILIAIFMALFTLFLAFALLSFMAGQFSPPVDTSGINLSSNLTTEELLPEQILGIPFNEETTHTPLPILNGVLTESNYDDVKISISKSDTEAYATERFENMRDSNPGYGYAAEHGGTVSTTLTSWWFTFETKVECGFCWKSGRWIFGVVAEGTTLRDQATEEFVEWLRGY